MREILFKAKAKDEPIEWVEGYLSKNEKEYIICDEEGFGIFINPDTICQYTGLTDKSGNKIWENDVVRYYDDIVSMNKQDLIEWNETHASFTRVHESQMGLQYLYIDECIANRCELIGNIFDNPELIN